MLDGIKQSVWQYHTIFQEQSKNQQKFDGLNLFAAAFFHGDMDRAMQYEIVAIVFPIFALSLDCMLSNM